MLMDRGEVVSLHCFTAPLFVWEFLFAVDGGLNE